MVNGEPRAIPLRVNQGDLLSAEPIDPDLAVARAASAGAVAHVMEQQRRAPVYLDQTVRAPKPRTAPPPPDNTVSKRPIHVRIGGVLKQAEAQPLPSPQKVAEVADGAPIPDSVLGDDDVLDLAVDLGGGPTDADLQHAKRQA
jgi:hypothetical protein